jgi:hypothetical protein
MVLDGKQMGDMVLLMPAQAFELETPPQQQTEVQPENATSPAAAA